MKVRGKKINIHPHPYPLPSKGEGDIIDYFQQI
jgi:hypothetical protein